MRRNLNVPTDLAYFYCYSPPHRPPAALAALVRVAGMRWPVEEDFRTGKDHVGLDHSQVRLYEALLRHLTLATAALASCAVTAAARAEGRLLTVAILHQPLELRDHPSGDVEQSGNYSVLTLVELGVHARSTRSVERDHYLKEYLCTFRGH